MPLRLVNKERSYPVTVCDTVFHIVSMTIGEKEKLLYSLANISTANTKGGESLHALLDLIAAAIVKIDGFDKPPREILEQIEDTQQLKQIVEAVVKHCNLSDNETKNSFSSSVQPIPVSVGNAEKLVVPDDAPVSNIPTKQAV